MNSKSPTNLSAKKLKVKIKSNKIKEANYLQKKIQSSTSQTYAESPIFFERRILTKVSTPLSYMNKKYKNLQEKKFFISKTRRINKYNPNNLITKKELIIDTRSDIFKINDINKQKRKKTSYNNIRNKRYQTYRINNKLKLDKNIQINTRNEKFKPKLNNSKNNINEENHTSYQTQMNFNNPLMNHNYIFSLSHPKVTNSLYTILAMRKNQFMDVYNDAKEKEKEFLPKVKQLQFLMDKTPMANFFSKKKDIRTFISPNNSPLPYISLLNDDYSISEKIRFQKIMDKLAKLKKCIEDNPKKEYDIAKEFLLSIGLYDVDNFYIGKLNNFIDFIKGNCIINPSKNMKENILDILKGNTIIQPPMSNVMNTNKKLVDPDIKLNEENQKMKQFLSEINLQNKNSDIVKNFKNTPSIIIKLNEHEQENDNNNNKDENNKKIYPKKIKRSHRVESVERLMTKKYQEVERNNSFSNLTEKEKEIITKFRGLPINLKRQKEIEKINNDVNLDLVIKPQYVINMLEKKFKDEQKANNDMRAKTYAIWSKDLREGKNPKLYGGKRNNSDYEELKKRNMLTEYICLMKAKNNYEIGKLKEKYNV